MSKARIELITTLLAALTLGSASPAIAQLSAPTDRETKTEPTAPAEQQTAPPRESRKDQLRRRLLEDVLNAVTRPPPVPPPVIREPIPPPALEPQAQPLPPAIPPPPRRNLPVEPTAAETPALTRPTPPIPLPPRRRETAPVLSSAPRPSTREPSSKPAQVSPIQTAQPAQPLRPRAMAPPTPQPAQAPAAPEPVASAAPEPVRTIAVEEAAPAVRGRPDRTIWWVLLGLIGAAAAALTARHWRNRAILAHTRAMVALSPSLDHNQGVCSGAGLALTGPQVAIRSRLEMGSSAWLKG